MLQSCDSNSTNVVDTSLTKPAVDVLDIDKLHLQAGEFRASNLPLGFALPPNGKVYAQTGADGNSEQGKANWNDCSLPSLTSAFTDAANGSGAIQIQNAGCLYQEFPLTPGKRYQLSCISKSQAIQYSSISLTLMSENYTSLVNDHKPVGQNVYQTYQTELFTPFEGRIGAVTLYSEDTAQFDDCAVVEL